MSARVSLERPCLRLRDSYVECLRDFLTTEPARPVKWEWLENFDLYLDWCRREQEAAEGRAPQTTYWIVVDGTHAVGKLTIRHALTPELESLGGHFGYEVRPAYRRRGIAHRAFALGLAQARARGIEGIVVTCDDDNLGSIRVLEGNGGRLLETYAVPGWPKPVRKYEFC